MKCKNLSFTLKPIICCSFGKIFTSYIGQVCRHLCTKFLSNQTIFKKNFASGDIQLLRYLILSYFR